MAHHDQSKFTLDPEGITRREFDGITDDPNDQLAAILQAARDAEGDPEASMILVSAICTDPDEAEALDDKAEDEDDTSKEVEWRAAAFIGRLFRGVPDDVWAVVADTDEVIDTVESLFTSREHLASELRQIKAVLAPVMARLEELEGALSARLEVDWFAAKRG